MFRKPISDKALTAPKLSLEVDLVKDHTHTLSVMDYSSEEVDEAIALANKIIADLERASKQCDKLQGRP